MRFYSQQNEDQILWKKYLNYRDGFFIELGAMDGITYSNSLFFEESLGWKGVLIEPTTQFYQLVNNRPNALNFNYAISEVESDVEFVGNGALGGIKDSMSEKHYLGWGLNNQRPYIVKSVPISKILKPLNIHRVDLFSIDVEGGELSVLKSFDWSIPVYLVLIEMAKHDLNKDQECRDFLMSKNFELDCEIGCNELWINKKFNQNENI